MLDPSHFSLSYDRHLCEALGSQGTEVRFFGRVRRHGEILCTRSYRVEPHFYRFAENARAASWPSPACRIIKGMEHISNMLSLQSRLAQWRPDVIHFQWLPLPIIDRSFLGKLADIAPLVWTAHDTHPFHGDPSSRLQLLGWEASLRQIDHFIAHTPYSKRQLIHLGIPEDRISIIPHGILKLDRNGADEQRAQHQRPVKDEKIVLFWGTIKPYKGVDVLVHAFAKLPRYLRNQARLWIVGRPRMPVESLKRVAMDLGVAHRITWNLRFVPDDQLHRWLEAADVVVFPYRNVDGSGALMTTLPYGKPIIATDVGGFPDVLEDGVHGYLVPSDDPARLAEVLRTVLQDPELSAKMGREILRLAQAIPSWAEIARQTIAAYRKAMRREGSRD